MASPTEPPSLSAIHSAALRCPPPTPSPVSSTRAASNTRPAAANSSSSAKRTHAAAASVPVNKDGSRLPTNRRTSTTDDRSD